MRKWLFIVPGLCLLILVPAAIVSHINGGSNPVERAEPLPPVDAEALPPIDIDEIAGQPPEAVAAILGQPTSFRTEEIFMQHIEGCPCPEMEYLDGTVKIAYINGLADWITVQHGPRPIKGTQDKYLFARQFDDHTYIEVTTSSEAP
ncbi:MAG: hypothetical protein ACFB0G_00995 [Leptolyngbyaceae cyanobacterium]